MDVCNQRFTLRLAIYRILFALTSPLRLTTSNFFIFQLNTCGYSPYVTPFLMRGLVLSFTTAAGPRQRSDSKVPVPRDSWPYFTVSDSRLPLTWRAGSPYFYPPRNRVPRLYHRALSSLPVASYDSTGYGKGIRPRLHTGTLRPLYLQGTVPRAHFIWG
jgi:hypothetical protein